MLHVARKLVGLSVIAVVAFASGCAAFPDTKTLGPTLDAAFPIRHGEKLAVIEPFTTMRVLEGGLTYLEISQDADLEPGGALASRPGALMSVNQGPWTDHAVVRRGDRVDVAYPNPVGGQSAGTLAYTIYGPTTKGYIRLAETRWYYDGYPEERKSLRVLPYDLSRLPAPGSYPASAPTASYGQPAAAVKTAEVKYAPARR